MMNTVFDVCKKHWVAIVVALFIGALYVGPGIFFMFDYSTGYQGVMMTGAPDDEHYYATINKIAGRGVSGNPYLYEYRDTRISVDYTVTERAFGFLMRAAGMGIVPLALGMRFLFPALLFLIVYAFGFAVSKSKATALLSGVFVLLGSEMLQSLRSFVPTILWHGPFADFLTYTRPINPQVSALFFFGTILLLYRLTQKPESRIIAIGAGCAVGLLAYLYFFFWAFCAVLLGLISLYLLLLRKRRAVGAVALVLGASVACALPFFFGMASALLHAGTAVADAVSLGKAYISTHEFIFEKVAFLPLMLLTALLAVPFLARALRSQSSLTVWIGAQGEKYTFLFLLALTACIVSNQQVLTGIEVQQQHFHFFTNLPMLLFICGVLLGDIAGYLVPQWKTLVLIVAGVLLFAYALGVQTSSYQFRQLSAIYGQRYAPVFSWLNAETNADTVVYADRELAEKIPYYTRDFVYAAGHAATYPVPLERLRHNYFVEMQLRGITADEAEDYMASTTVRNDIGQQVFEGQYYRDACGSYGCFPDGVLQNLIKEYRAFADRSFEANLKKYKVDYIIWDTSKDPEWHLDQYSFLQKVYEGNGIVLFKVT